MTRKEKHAEAIRFLITAAEAMDQAQSVLKDAETMGFVCANTRRTFADFPTIVNYVDLALGSAKEATCDDCDLLIVACPCAWANEQIGRNL